jgi:hypothetical protein
MIVVVVAGDMMRDRADTQLLKIRHRSVALVPHTVIEEDGFTSGRDQQCAIALTDIHEVQLKAAIGEGSLTKKKDVR